MKTADSNTTIFDTIFNEVNLQKSLKQIIPILSFTAVDKYLHNRDSSTMQVIQEYIFLESNQHSESAQYRAPVATQLIEVIGNVPSTTHQRRYTEG